MSEIVIVLGNRETSDVTMTMHSAMSCQGELHATARIKRNNIQADLAHIEGNSSAIEDDCNEVLHKKTTSKYFM